MNDLVEEFAQLLEKMLAPGERVLEIGAGNGLLAKRLAEAGYDVLAIDREGRDTFPIEVVTFKELAFEDFDSPSESFDAVIAQLVLHHVSDLDATLAKIKRIVKPSGFIAVDDYGWERIDDPGYRARHSDLLTSETMLAGLREHFAQALYKDHPYVDDDQDKDNLGFTFVGSRRSIRE